jgi:hypothetical protein
MSNSATAKIFHFFYVDLNLNLIDLRNSLQAKHTNYRSHYFEEAEFPADQIKKPRYTAGLRGQYWVRTSDPYLVEVVL